MCPVQRHEQRIRPKQRTWASGRVCKVCPPFPLFFIHFTHVLCFILATHHPSLPTAPLLQSRVEGVSCHHHHSPSPPLLRTQAEGVFLVTLPANTHHRSKCELRGFLCHHHPSPIPPLLETQVEGVFHATTTTPHQPFCRSKCEWRVSYHSANSNDNEDDSCSCHCQ